MNTKLPKCSFVCQRAARVKLIITIQSERELSKMEIGEVMLKLEQHLNCLPMVKFKDPEVKVAIRVHI